MTRISGGDYLKCIRAGRILDRDEMKQNVKRNEGNYKITEKMDVNKGTKCREGCQLENCLNYSLKKLLKYKKKHYFCQESHRKCRRFKIS